MKHIILLTMLSLSVSLCGQDAKPAPEAKPEIPEAQQDESVRNMRHISDVLIVYAGTRDDQFPEPVGVAGLEKIRHGLQIETLIAPFDKTSVPVKKDEVLTEKNTSYAYIGSGLSIGKGYDGGRITTPILIEKPWLRKDGKIAVVDMGGRINIKKIEATNCLEAVYKLRENNYPNEPYWVKLIASAKEIDKANGIQYREQ